MFDERLELVDAHDETTEKRTLQGLGFWDERIGQEGVQRDCSNCTTSPELFGATKCLLKGYPLAISPVHFEKGSVRSPNV